MPQGETKRILKVVKGHEWNFTTSYDICSTQSFMYPAFKQATLALLETVRQTEGFHKAYKPCQSDELSNLLFQYSGNIITFAAQRGGGKTSTMLSFANLLSQKSIFTYKGSPCGKCDLSFLNEESLIKFQKCSFLVLPPISPSTLEEWQDILHVILSRLYCFANELIKTESLRSWISEDDKRKLSGLLQNCLSGINGIKKQDLQCFSDLDSLKNIGDGIELRKYFYELVRKLLAIAYPSQDTADKFLVLQLDDADSQIKNGYEVLEDVRKYLVIPNLIILMSADIKMLRNVIMQDQLSKFKDLVQMPNIDIDRELTRMCQKYIDKLIPPSHMIYLPQLDAAIEATGSDLLLQYVKVNGETETEVFDWMRGQEWALQDMLLMLIYRKTRIAFVAPNAYLHNIIPRTLRGLNQLISILEGMDDIPILNPRKWTSVKSYCTELQAQIMIEEHNLSKFATYFTKIWMYAKIRVASDRYFLDELSETASRNRVRLAVQHLLKKYEIHPDEERFPDESRWEEVPYTRSHLDSIMNALEKKYRTQDDFLLLFTIRTLFSLESHQLVLMQKKQQLEDFRSSSLKTSRKESPVSKVLAFDLDPDQTNLPHCYRIKEENAAFKVGQLVIPTGLKGLAEQCQQAATKVEKRSLCKEHVIRASIGEGWEQQVIEAIPQPPDICVRTDLPQGLLAAAWDYDYLAGGEEAGTLFRQIMTQRDRNDEKYRMNFLNLITLLLRLGNQAFEAEGKEVVAFQRKIYRAQESALFIASNWDVQARIYEMMQKPKIANDAAVGINTLLGILYKEIDSILKEINGGRFVKYLSSAEFVSIYSAFVEIVLEGKNQTKIPDLWSHAMAICGMQESDSNDESPKKVGSGVNPDKMVTG